jgi:hypothetical protein
MIEPMASEAALARHRQSKGYTVVVGDLKRPHCFLEVGSTCLVCYFDELRRTPDSYSFIEVNGRSESLFLASVIQREYDADSKNVIRARTYGFSSDGKVRIIESDIPTGENRVTDAYAVVDDYLVKKPAFGEYDEFIRKRTINLRS